MSFDRSKTPTWRTGYRYQYEPAQKGHVLLYPEGMIKLNESAALDAQFPGVPELAEDIEQFMEVARAQHWIDLA